MFEIIILGSGGSIPVEGRNHPAVLVRFEGWNLLFDAGEDVQRQYERVNAGLNKRTAIFISHMHADHILGLPGLLLRMSLLDRMRPLDVYGPPGIVDFIRVSQDTIHLGTTFESTVYGISSGTVFSFDDLQVEALEVDHRGIAFGYKVEYQRPTGTFLVDKAKELNIPKGPLWGKLAGGESVTLKDGREISPIDVTEPKPAPIRIIYSGDTRPCDVIRKASKNANVLIHEAMYSSSHSDLADKRGHSTAKDVAELAKKANVDLLVLTHYSPRYGDGSEIISEAKETFSNTVLARDLMKINLSLDGNISITQSDD
ncbi:MAG: Ribonuclease Z [Candidatus Thorarchaeota archaeon]|nr:MAG: Ribonuclease Z [Candidatus Thorarchaeota archaeon]